MATKSLDPETKERLCALVETIVNRDFGGNKTAAAKGLGVSQSYISEMVQRRRGPGSTMLEALADHLHTSVDELMGRDIRREYDANPTLRHTAVGRHREWSSARDEVLRLYGKTIDTDILAKVERANLGFMPEHLSVDVVKRLYDVIQAVEIERARAETQQKR